MAKRSVTAAGGTKQKKGKHLVIVESPAKARTIGKFLGKSFQVLSCAGHVRDLPKSRLGVDIEHQFEPSYVTIRGKNKIVKELTSAAKASDRVYLAPDPDREGEAIAWHLKQLLKKKPEDIFRIEFNEITKQAVQTAVHEPREIDEKRFQAQQARRILDRLVGYSLSPLLWRKIRRGLSAGRVQSVAVRLICDREAEITAFKPEEYWYIDALLTPELATVPDGKPRAFQARLYGRGKEKLTIPHETMAREVSAHLKQQHFQVAQIEEKRQQRHPAPPFITSTLQQEASRKLRFSARKTMLIAQQLYEGIAIHGEGAVGLISYMRTDSVRIAEEALGQAHDYIAKTYGDGYALQEPRRFKTKKQAQDAHEAIRPTSIFRTPDHVKKDLTPDQYKLYRLIWERFVASQMASAVFDLTTVEIAGGEYCLRATGRVMIFNGFMAIYVEGEDEGPKEQEGEVTLPPLREGEHLLLQEITPSQHFTEPPPRYTEASLVKALEKLGIGRPSTYAPIVATIRDRGYVEMEQRKLFPTELGEMVNELLLNHFPKIVDTQFTAQMEDELDGILEGVVDWHQMLATFYAPFLVALKAADQNIEKMETVKPSDEICEKCGKPMVIRVGRFGEFLACTGFPECSFTKDMSAPAAGLQGDVPPCEKCGKPMVTKHGRFGPFLACSGYPECRNIRSIQKKLGVSCPKCKGDLIERRSKRGRNFYGCSNYPKCDFASWDKPISDPCPKCGSLMVEKWMKGRQQVYLCVNKEGCGYQRESAGKE